MTFDRISQFAILHCLAKLEYIVRCQILFSKSLDWWNTGLSWISGVSTFHPKTSWSLRISTLTQFTQSHFANDILSQMTFFTIFKLASMVFDLIRSLQINISHVTYITQYRFCPILLYVWIGCHNQPET